LSSNIAERTVVARKNNPERTKIDILNAATEEFSKHGLNGARVDVIAARTQTAKRMIYYYFGSKDGLYLAVLERAYSLIRAAERGLNLKGLAPVAAVTRLVEFTFDYQEACVDFVRLVANENIHHGEFVKRSKVLGDLNVTILQGLSDILRRGQAEAVFRPDLDPLDVHLLMTAFCHFRVSNQHTLRAIFKRDLLDPQVSASHRAMLVESILGYLQKGCEAATAPALIRPPSGRRGRKKSASSAAAVNAPQ
jgi:AcrR family transcriptional regulator